MAKSVTTKKNRTLAEREGDPPEVVPDYLAGLIEQNPFEHAPIGPNEVIWAGGGQRIDPGDYTYGDLGTRSALDQILLAIISGHQGVDVGRRGGKTNNKDMMQYRLEQATRFLTGHAPPRGQVPTEYEEGLDRVARRFFLAYYGFEEEHVTLRALLEKEFITAEQRATLDHKQIDNILRSPLRAFQKHKDRLLVKASSFGLPEVEERTQKIAAVIQLLHELQITKPPKG